MTIQQWNIPITGFTQHAGAANGFDRLWNTLRPLSSGTTAVVTPQRWRANFDHLADFIDRHSIRPTINVYAYSWGCGHGFIQLAKHLKKRGLQIKHAVLCDPVYHSWLRPWRALICSPAIKIPSNVTRVSWFRQYQDKPRATELKAADPRKTHIEPPVILQRAHAWMEDAPEFTEKCLAVAKG